MVFHLMIGGFYKESINYSLQIFKEDFITESSFFYIFAKDLRSIFLLKYYFMRISFKAIINLIFLMILSISVQNVDAKNLSALQAGTDIQRRVVPRSQYTKHLKKYNIIIATLSSQEGVDRLKKKFDSDDQRNLIVRNDKGLYYFVLASYDKESEVIAGVKSVADKYTNRYSRNELIRKYGIPFSDIWILEIE